MKTLGLLRALLFAVFFVPSLQASPDLLVVIVVDQMRADYFDRFAFVDGFKTLRQGSQYFTAARFDHVPLDTASGHAVIATGLPPGKTGIVSNWWYDRAEGGVRSSVADPRFGVGGGSLQAPTLGDRLKKENVRSKVYSVSLKDRSAALMAGQSSDGAFWLSESAGGFGSSGYFRPLPPWVEEFNRRMRSTDPNVAGGPKLRSLLNSSQADFWTLQFAATLLARAELGQDDAPDILWVSLSATDVIGHRQGPGSAEIKNHLSNLDRWLGEFVGEVKKAARQGRYRIVLTADHGVLPVPESAAGRQMNARRIPKRNIKAAIEEKLQRLRRIEGGWVRHFDGMNVVLNENAMASVDWKKVNLARVLMPVEGVAAVYHPAQWRPADAFVDFYRRSYFPGRSGDFMVRLEPGVLLSEGRSGTSHGSPYDYDRRVPLLYFGPDVVASTMSAPVSVESIVGSLAEWLKLGPP